MAHRRVNDLIARCAQSIPEAPAIVTEGGGFTYSELNERSAALAEVLVRLGVGPGCLIPLLVERSPGAIVAMLAVMRAGAAYVPLDPRTPGPRNAALCLDCRAVLLIAQEHLRWAASQVIVSARLRIDWWGAPIGCEGSMVDTRQVDADNLAYVIYTSGTTGTPNGVLISHEALGNYIGAAANLYCVEPGDRVLQFAPYTFDNSAEEIFVALTRGASIVLRTHAMMQSAERFFAFCEKHCITVLDLPTAYWRSLGFGFRPEGPRVPASVRLVVVGGEEADVDSYERWRKACSRNVRFLNTYGPTETTIGITASELSEVDLSDGIIPIGRPIGGAMCHILDATHKPVPDGEAGELALGGNTLALGYLNRPSLTRTRFIADTLSPDENERLFLTGDRVRRRPDGEIEYLGRIDAQIKIRGIRVDLREIAATVRQASGAEETVIVPLELSSGLRLIAYLAGESREPMSSVRERVRAALPPAMVPSEYRCLKALPRTLSNKIDLTALIRVEPPVQGERETARTDVERDVAAVWEQVLRRHDIGRDENFFDIGGDSLLAIILLQEVETRFRAQLDPSQFVANPTIAGIAQSLTSPSTRVPFQNPADDAFLPPNFPTVIPAETRCPASVLVTGATGFIGAHLIAELLQDQRIERVTCIVRAPTSCAARRRLEERLHFYGILDKGVTESQLTVLAGDVSKPFLGLSDSEYETLTCTIDTIFHLAARVHLTLSYDALRATNVGGTLECLELAVADRPMTFVYISTLDAAKLDEHKSDRLVAAALNPTESGGYTTSKWVAERLVQQAAERGLRCTIARPGWVVASSKTGISNGHDLPSYVLSEALATGIVPDCELRNFRPIHVDHLCLELMAAATGGIGSQPVPMQGAAVVGTEHLLALLRDNGWHLRTVPFEEWLAVLRERAQSSASAESRSLLALWAGLGSSQPLRSRGESGTSNTNGGSAIDFEAFSQCIESTLIRIARSGERSQLAQTPQRRLASCMPD